MCALSLDPGRFRRALDLEQQVRTPDGAGGFAESWTMLATVFAELTPLAATSTVSADQEVESVTHRVRLRTRTGVSAGMRFREGTRVYEIVTVHDPDETGRYLECRARERLP
ncbi:MAG: phage head closure protein [Rhizobiaceae bacterium]